MTIDYYDILNISKDATEKEIKDAYRNLSKTHHPDKGGDPEEFHLIKKAYETLIDKNKRAQYDKFGSDADDHQRIINCAITIFKTAVERNLSNLTLSILEVYEAGGRELNQHKTKAENEIKKIDKVLSKIKEAPKNDFINQILTAERAGQELQIEQINKSISTSEIAFKLLKEYTFEDSIEIGDGEESPMYRMMRESMPWTI